MAWAGLSREEIHGLAADFSKSLEILRSAATDDHPDDEQAAMADFLDMQNLARVMLLRAVLDLGSPPDRAEDAVLEVLKLAARMGASGTA